MTPRPEPDNFLTPLYRELQWAFLAVVAVAFLAGVGAGALGDSMLDRFASRSDAREELAGQMRDRALKIALADSRAADSLRRIRVVQGDSVVTARTEFRRVDAKLAANVPKVTAPIDSAPQEGLTVVHIWGPLSFVSWPLSGITDTVPARVGDVIKGQQAALASARRTIKLDSTYQATLVLESRRAHSSKDSALAAFTHERLRATIAENRLRCRIVFVPCPSRKVVLVAGFAGGAYLGWNAARPEKKNGSP